MDTENLLKGKGEYEMKITMPEPFFFEGGKKAILLLHGFTGNSADVRMIGRFLNKQGYTCYAPHYKGHGVPPEELVKSGPTDWWGDVKDAYQFLVDKGYSEIAVCGLSLGGVFSLKVGMTFPVKGIITMCAPAYTDNEQELYVGVLAYARNFKKRLGLTDEQIEEEMSKFQPMSTLKELHELVEEVISELDAISAPLFAIQARKDVMIDTDSVNVIYDGVSSIIRRKKWYENSPHVITLGPEKEEMHEDIYEFLETLPWTNN